MDRNFALRIFSSSLKVALRKESVDRNFGHHYSFKLFKRVALRKESVDRNTNFSPASLFGLPVALRKESVDRNGCHCQNWVIYV